MELNEIETFAIKTSRMIRSYFEREWVVRLYMTLLKNPIIVHLK